MPAAAAPALGSPAVLLVLDSGKTNKLDVTSGRLQELHADCPNDGAPSTVRRVTREHGGGIMEVTLRCPRCYTDFIAPREKLYLS